MGVRGYNLAVAAQNSLLLLVNKVYEKSEIVKVYRNAATSLFIPLPQLTIRVFTFSFCSNVKEFNESVTRK